MPGNLGGAPNHGSTPDPTPQYGGSLAGTQTPAGFSYGSGARAATDAQNKDVADAQARLEAGVNSGDINYAMGGGFSKDAASLKTSADSANNPNPEYGGYAGGASDAANHYSSLGSSLALRLAPKVDLANANEARGYGTNALSLDQQAAMGNAPSAAEAQFGRNLGQSINSQAAIANSARGGGAGLAAAQRTGATTAAGMSAQGAQDAAALRAQEMATARAQYGQQAVSQQGLDTSTALGVSGQQLQQDQLNQQGQLSYEQLANQAQTEQLQADTARYGANTTAMTAANQLGSDNTWKKVATYGEMAGAAMADLHLKEPSGPAHWSLREEPDFILARNERNGELRKVATEPLSSSERKQAEAPHGAGPLGSMASPRTRTVSDLSLGQARSMADHGMTDQENPFYTSKSEADPWKDATTSVSSEGKYHKPASFLHYVGSADGTANWSKPGEHGQRDDTWHRFQRALEHARFGDQGQPAEGDPNTYAADLHLGGPFAYRVHPSEGTKSGQKSGQGLAGLSMMREKM